MYDIALLKWLHNNPLPHSIQALQFISDTTTIVSIALVVVVLVMSFFRKINRGWTRFITLVVVLLVVAGVTHGLKALIHRDRPFDTYPYIEKLSSGGDSSFPSGHTLEAFAMAAAVSFLFSRRKIFLALYAWAIVVAYSRMALGVHYPSDVVAGIIIGTTIGIVVPWTFKILSGTEDHHPDIS